MANFKMKCPECSHEFLGESTIEYIACPSCNAQISVNKAIKYYQSLNKIKTEKKAIARGEAYAKVDLLLEEAKWYIDNGDYETALLKTDEALTLTNVDSRVYLTRVYAKTKNFTDYDDTTHFKDLKKALDLSPVFEKERIRDLYSVYYKKTKIPKEEMLEYENQETASRLNRVEILLKDSIPAHFSREKTIRRFWAFESPALAVAVALLILSVTLQITALSIVGAVVLLASAFAFIKYFDLKNRVRCFNGVLDLYDNFEKLHLKPKTRFNTSKTLEKLAVSEINNESTYKTDELVIELLNELIASDEETALNFILNHPSFKKYVKKEQD